MTRAETYGHRFSLAVAEYLKANNLSSLGKINSRVLADIAQKFHDNEKKVVKRAVKLASEEEWVASLEADPLWAGVDVRRELGKCQFHFKDTPRKVTRRTFKAWLLKGEGMGILARSYDGATSKPAKAQPPKPRYTLETPVAGWPLLLRSVVDLGVPDTVIDGLCEKDWHELPVDVREKIIHAA